MKFDFLKNLMIWGYLTFLNWWFFKKLHFEKFCQLVWVKGQKGFIFENQPDLGPCLFSIHLIFLALMGVHVRAFQFACFCTCWTQSHVNFPLFLGKCEYSTMQNTSITALTPLDYCFYCIKKSVNSWEHTKPSAHYYWIMPAKKGKREEGEDWG